MKKILAILTAVAAISMLVLTVSADVKATGTNEITIYAPKDGDLGGSIQVAVDGTAALTGQTSSKGLVVPADDDANKLGIVALGVKAGDAVAVLTFSGSGTVTVTGLSDDFTGSLGSFTVGAPDEGVITTAAPEATTEAPSAGGDGADGPPKTGIVIAVVPMALAAAAAAVSKKK